MSEQKVSNVVYQGKIPGRVKYTFAFGALGKDLIYNNYYNYYNYYNNYYYGYNNYYNYYNYNYYASPSTDSETVTTTTISTEVLPYTPLVFTIFVEEE